MSGSDADPGAAGFGRRRWAALLLVVVGVVHSRAWFGRYVYDDVLLVTQNTALRTDDFTALLTRPLFDGFADYWRPLTMFVLWVGDGIGGSTGVHALAWVAHLVATWLAFRVALRVTGSAAAAYAAALLFGVHPVQVEGVAWCSAINDPLWWALGFWCVDAVLRSAHLSSGVAFLLALLAKENAIVLLPVALTGCWWARRSLRSTTVVLSGACAVWWLLRACVFGSPAGGLGHGAPDAVVAANWPIAALELFGRELELLVWPWPLSPFRVLHGDPPTLVRAGVWGCAWLAAVVATSWRGARGAAFALVLVGAPILLAAALVHRLGPYPVADRYLGPAVLGAGLLLVGRRSGRVRLGVAFVVAAAGAMASLWQAGVWRDARHLIEHGLTVAPGDPGVLVLAGNELLDRGDVGDARDRYTTALQAAVQGPGGVPSRAALDAEAGLGWCMISGRPPRPDLAAESFENVVRVDGDHVVAWIGLGVAHGMLGHADRAESALRRAIDLDPSSSRAHFNLAYLLRLLGRFDEARQSAAAALRSDPANSAAARMLEELDGQSIR